jgi:uncharacterized protein YqiB (DUF1249 family)
MMDICKTNFLKLLALWPTLREMKPTKIDVPRGTPLYVDVLSRRGSTAMLSLSQYCILPSGHVVADPTMIVAVNAGTGTVEALVFQNYLGMRHTHSDQVEKIGDLAVVTPMNQFLGHWLANVNSERG